MKTLRKRLTAALLTLALALGLGLWTPKARAAASDEILMPELRQYKEQVMNRLNTVELVLGKMRFSGQLKRKSQLTDEDIRDIRQEHMRLMGMSEEELLQNQQLRTLNEFKKTKEAAGMGERVMAAAGLSVHLNSIRAAVSGTANSGQIAYDAATAVGGLAAGAAIGALAPAFATGAGAIALSVMINMGFTYLQEGWDFLQSKRFDMAVAEAQKDYNKLVRNCLRELEDKDERTPAEWTLTVRGLQTRDPFTLFGTTGNTQQWRVEVEMTRQETGYVNPFNHDTGWQGIYEGIFKITVSHKLDGFDKQFYKEIFQETVLYHGLDSFFGFHEKTEGASYMEYNIGSANETLSLESESNVVPIDVERIDHELDVLIAPKVRAGNMGGLVDDEGQARYTGDSGYVDLDYKMDLGYSAQPTGVTALSLILEKVDLTAKSLAVARGHSEQNDYSQYLETGQLVVMDTQAFAPLNGARICVYGVKAKG